MVLSNGFYFIRLFFWMGMKRWVYQPKLLRDSAWFCVTFSCIPLYIMKGRLKCFQTALAFYPCIFSWTGNKRFTSTIHCLQRAGVACACHANPPFKVTTHTPTFKSPWQYVYRTYQTPTFTPARVNFVFEGVVEIMRRRYLGEVVWKSGFRRFCYFYDVLYLTRLAI